MSKISSKPELGNYDEIIYTLNLYRKNGKLYIEIDEAGNAKTNIKGLIHQIVDYKNKGQIIYCDHDEYNKINRSIDPFSGKIIKKINNIIKI